jgi:hypothetical protein
MPRERAEMSKIKRLAMPPGQILYLSNFNGKNDIMFVKWAEDGKIIKIDEVTCNIPPH